MGFLSPRDGKKGVSRGAQKTWIFMFAVLLMALLIFAQIRKDHLAKQQAEPAVTVEESAEDAE